VDRGPEEWIGTGQLIGSAAAGLVIDAQEAQGAFVVAAALLAVGAATAAVFHWHGHDLRGRDAGPMPDTEPVAIVT
jgi:hypothetical protein